MGQVEIQFEGICVNFKQSEFPSLPAKHRIVLINASTITNVWGETISPHLAAFSLGSDLTVETIPLSGAVVKIANPITDERQPGVTYDTAPNSAYANIPSLTALTPSLTSVPSPAVLTGDNPDLVSCFFDIDFGTISSRGGLGGSIMTVVTILTDGDPLYQLTPFATGLSSSPILEVEPQPATGQMFFSNEETEVSQAKDEDFLLSYLVLSPPPSTTPNIPLGAVKRNAANRKSEIARKLSNGPLTFSDIGCSNSQYP